MIAGEDRERYSADLDAAHDLVDMGVPVFVGRLGKDGNPDRTDRRWREWQNKQPSHRVVDTWQPGLALCAVMGFRFDALDKDPRNGGKLSWKRMASDLGDDGPQLYGTVATPSGGQHYYVAATGLGTVHGFLPGLDLQGGKADGSSRGFVFLPPTARASKADGQVRRYSWIDQLAQVNGDGPSAALTAYVRDALAGHATDSEDTRRPPVAHLEAAVFAAGTDAGTGTQRIALLKLVQEWERQHGSGTPKVLALTIEFLKQVPNLDPKDPWWPARGPDPDHWAKSLQHAAGQIIADAEPGELDGIEDAVRSDKQRGKRGAKEYDDLVRIETMRYRARLAARDAVEAERRAAGGDEGLFRSVNLATVEDPPPLVLGADGAFPRTGLAHLFGPPNIGKSPLLGFVALSRVRAGWDDGELFGIYELEIGPQRWRRLLTDLGATPEELERIPYYSNMAAPVDLVKHGRALCRAAIADGCRGLGFDSLISMLVVSQIGENDPQGVRAWFDDAARPMASSGGFALVVDHVGLGDDERGRGSSDKGAATDFSVAMKCHRPGRRGESGEYSLLCVKDRNAVFIGDSMKLGHRAIDDRHFTYEPEGWSFAEDTDRGRDDAETQTKIVDAMAETTRPLSILRIAEITGMDKEAIRSALRRGATGRNPVFLKVGRGEYELLHKAVG